ncbi:MAG: membrane protein insertase YidC [Kosmotoga sp.]|nr:MAG: membrane protein insertase YidC [Kosmotoga sp.]
MNKRAVIVAVFVMLLFSAIFSAKEPTVEATSGLINIETTTMKFVLNTELGVLERIDMKVEGKSELIYRYANDGFDIFEDNEKLIPGDFDYYVDENTDVVVEFYYEGGTKTFVIKNDPFYNFLVITNFPGKTLKMKIPYISVSAQDERSGYGYHVSFSDKPTSVFVTTSDVGRFSLREITNISGTAVVRNYAGPKKLVYISEAVPNHYEEVKQSLDDIGALSIFSYIHHGLVVSLYWFRELTNSFGWAIIIFTLIIRLILYPLYHIQTKSMIEMRRLQPEMEKIKKKYKDKQKQQEALMKMYKKEGVNPGTGCLTLLIQLPVFFVLYSVIRYFSEMFAYSPRFFIWNDLSTGGFGQNILLILISVAAGIYMATITSQDGRSARQAMIMSLIFPFLFYSLPTGLFIYYATNSVIQLLITMIVYKRYDMKGVSFREVLGLPAKPAK